MILNKTSKIILCTLCIREMHDCLNPHPPTPPKLKQNLNTVDLKTDFLLLHHAVWISLWKSCSNYLNVLISPSNSFCALLPSVLYSNPFYSVYFMAVNSVMLALCTQSKPQILCQTDSTFMSRIITGDESWAAAYDPDTKEQCSAKDPTVFQSLKAARQIKSATSSLPVY